MLHRALVSSLLVDQGLQPTGGEKTKLRILFLGRQPDVLQDARAVGCICEDRIDSRIAGLRADLLHRSAELNQVLKDYLNHRVNSRTACPGNFLDQKTTTGRQGRSQRIHHLENAIE